MTSPSVCCPTCFEPASSAGPCGTCGFGVPLEWLAATDRISIAMTGARSSGKSVLIAVLVTQLEEFLSRHHGTYLRPVGDVGQMSPEIAREAPPWFSSLGGRFAQNYLVPLYHQRGLLPGTARLEEGRVEPLIWSFRVGDRTCCLSLIDAAGEDFQELEPTDQRFNYLGKVDVLVTLVDPLKVPQIRSALAGIINFPAGAGDDLNVLRRVLEARSQHLAAESSHQTLAVVLSKFDVLHQLKDIQAKPFDDIMLRPGAAMRRDPSMSTPLYDEEDGRLLDAELRGLLEFLQGVGLLNAVAQSRMPARLFATAALGVVPGTDSLGRGGMNPFRVLDFVKDVLTRRGVIA